MDREQFTMNKFNRKTKVAHLQTIIFLAIDSTTTCFTAISHVHTIQKTILVTTRQLKDLVIGAIKRFSSNMCFALTLTCQSYRLPLHI
jgi:hypothetical protein